MPEKLTLYVCRIDDRGPGPHACRRAQRALSGQEMLPVLVLTDSSTVSGGSKIVAWAKANAPAPAGQAST